MTLEDYLTWGAIAMFGVSAFLWLASTLVKASAAKVKAAYKKAGGWGSPMQITDDDGSDFIATVRLQSLWNRWAALATAVALALQAAATLLNSN